MVIDKYDEAIVEQGRSIMLGVLKVWKNALSAFRVNSGALPGQCGCRRCCADPRIGRMGLATCLLVNSRLAK